MAHEIESPLGKTRIQSPHRRAVFTVDSEEQQSAMVDEQIRQAARGDEQPKDERFAVIDDVQKLRKEALQAKNKIPMDSKKRLEVLLGIGRATEDVEIDGVVFSLQTLKDNEMEDVAKLPKLFVEDPQKFKESTGVEFLFYLRRFTLALSIYKVDGLSFDEAFGCNSFEDRINVLADLDSNLTYHLFQKYEILKNKTIEKYSIKGPEDVKGVIEDVKKS